MANRASKNIIAFCKRLLGSAAIAGVIVAFVGFYYVAIRAGIPYQDPPLELQIEYGIYMEVGVTLMAVGSVSFFVCAVIWVVLKYIQEHNRSL